jgi:hypothetical protein
MPITFDTRQSNVVLTSVKRTLSCILQNRSRSWTVFTNSTRVRNALRLNPPREIKRYRRDNSQMWHRHLAMQSLCPTCKVRSATVDPGFSKCFLTIFVSIFSVKFSENFSKKYFQYLSASKLPQIFRFSQAFQKKIWKTETLWSLNNFVWKMNSKILWTWKFAVFPFISAVSGLFPSERTQKLQNDTFNWTTLKQIADTAENEAFDVP